MNVELSIRSACDILYRDQKLLIDNRTHERTIAAHIAAYLKPLFDGWQVDSDYNRVGDKGKVKRGRDGKPLIPDIIIHQRGVTEGPNLVAIQVKGYWNREERGKDEDDLRDMRSVYHYQFLYRLELGLKSYELIQVDPLENPKVAGRPRQR